VVEQTYWAVLAVIAEGASIRWGRGTEIRDRRGMPGWKRIPARTVLAERRRAGHAPVNERSRSRSR